MKQYKCAFGHCAHDGGKVNQDEAVRIGTRYWHKDCYEISELVKEIREDYLNNFSSTVVVSFLNKVINEIIFGKKLENKKVSKAQSNLEAARYLSFAVKYAISNSIPITHVPGLYYLIDNTRVKKAYEKQNELKTQKEMREAMKNEDVTKAEAPKTEYKPSTKFSSGGNVGFGSIFKGGN